MIKPDEIGKRFHTLWAIILGDNSKLPLLDLSPSGFAKSFQAIPLALIPFFLQWALLMQNRAALPQHFNHGGILLRLAFIELCQWIIPLMLVIAASGLFGIRDRIIPFVITCNWGKVFLQYVSAPFTGLQLLLPDAYALHWFLQNVLLIFSVYALYRLFQAALNKTIGYMLPFIILYTIISAFVLVLASGIVGWSFLPVKTG